MKRIFAVLLVLPLAIFMTACGSTNNRGESLQNQALPSENDMPAALADNSAQTEEVVPEVQAPEPEISEPEAPEQTSDSKILVAYFSRVGNTVWEDGVDAVTSASLNVVDGAFAGNAQLLAQMVQQTTGGNLFLIQTEDAYPSDYRETINQASVEQADDARPSLSSHVEDMDSYDIIVLVYPNWWGTLPQPLFTFLEEYDFSGKTILPLCTHEGSRMGRSEQAIAQLCPDAVLLDGLSVRGSSAASAQSDVESWINNSGILG